MLGVVLVLMFVWGVVCVGWGCFCFSGGKAVPVYVYAGVAGWEEVEGWEGRGGHEEEVGGEGEGLAMLDALTSLFSSRSLLICSLRALQSLETAKCASLQLMHLWKVEVQSLKWCFPAH